MRYNYRRYMFLSSIFYFLFSRRTGQATFSFIFLVGGIVVVIGITLAVLALSLINISFGFRASERAAAAASSGAEDAILRLMRNKSFASGGYAVPVDAFSATVVVTQDTPLFGQTTIDSSATVSNYQRKIRVVTQIHPMTGEVQVISWKKIVL